MTTNFGYTLDVWKYMLHTKEEGVFPGFFDEWSIIHVGGDHGGHFANAGLMIEESKFYRLHAKEIRICFFPAYHAHGRADAAGAEDKRAAIRDMKDKKMRFGAAGYTRMTNASNDSRSLAFDMGKINRSAAAYTKKNEREPAGEIRQWNQVSYEYKNRCEATEGIVKFRMVSGQSAWTFMDLVKRKKKPLRFVRFVAKARTVPCGTQRRIVLWRKPTKQQEWIAI